MQSGQDQSAQDQSGQRQGLVVVIGTGGTIAGTAPAAGTHTGYQAGVLGADALVAALPALQGQALETIGLVQMDSCDMDNATWLALRRTVAAQLARADVAGVVITHGTDTLEETAYFLHRTLHALKPVVLTAAMRPANAPSADGPQNLLDAVKVARTPGACGVVAVLAGRVHAGADLRKLHGYRVDAFNSGDAGPLAVLEDGALRMFRAWPEAALHGVAARLHSAVVDDAEVDADADAKAAADADANADAHAWPLVDIVTSHAGAQARTLDALVASGANGIVIAGTGNGSVHRALLAAARRATDAGVVVRRASRCLLGGVVGLPGPPAAADGAAQGMGALPHAGPLTPVQARIELLLDLLAAR